MGETVVTNCCWHDCPGRCLLKVHVKDGVIVRIETDDGAEPQLRACSRGRAQRQRVYAPDRLRYPMRRVGPRGEGSFERIGWDEALDEVASQLKRIKEQYGPGVIINLQYAGNQGSIQSSAVGRLLNKFGGHLQHWGGASAEADLWASRATYGTTFTGHTGEDLLSSHLIILWGKNPAELIYGDNSTYNLARAREAGARVVCVDPRFTDSAAVFADRWIPIRPGTDTAMLVAMAHVMITESLYDRDFIDTYTVGFDRFKDYVLGTEDGVAKTPQWAEAITGVGADDIVSLAREYATTRPAALINGYGPGRTAYGEQYHRAAATLAAMTANIGIHGGNPAGRGFPPTMATDSLSAGVLPRGKNPLGAGAPRGISTSLDTALKSSQRVLQCKIYDAILKGKAGGYPGDIKMVWVNCGNTLNQFPNTNKGVEAFKRLEFIVAQEQFMTATARFADILLPVVTNFETDDFHSAKFSCPYYIYSSRAIEPLYEAKSDFQICAELAPRLGINDYSDKAQDEWLREIVMANPVVRRHVADFDAFRKEGVCKVSLPEAAISFSKEIADPENNPFPTPSGKIEIYSQRVADIDDPEMPPIPRYIETWEGRNDPLAGKYPLQLITPHAKTRAHSNFDNIPWVKELEPQQVWLNTADAAARGIADGDEVRIFNDRGEIIITAKVTERIMPGVVSINQGAWYRPDSGGADRGGCPNVLTRDEHSPAGGWCTHTALVQVAGYGGK